MFGNRIAQKMKKKEKTELANDILFNSKTQKKWIQKKEKIQTSSYCPSLFVLQDYCVLFARSLSLSLSLWGFECLSSAKNQKQTKL